MGEEIQIKKASEQDLDAIRDLAQRVWDVTYIEIVPKGQIEYMLSKRYAREILTEQLRRGDEILLASRGDVLKGFAHAIAGDEGECQLDKLYVDLDSQRQGVGETLLRGVRNWAISVGLTKITLRVNRRNEKAVQAYHKYGFRILCEDLKEIGEGYFMDDFIMICALGE